MPRTDLRSQSLSRRWKNRGGEEIRIRLLTYEGHGGAGAAFCISSLARTPGYCGELRSA
jgi:hypothetical protein